MKKKNRPVLIKENNINLDDFPPILRKLAERILENYSFNSFKELCEKESISYKSIMNAISREKKKGNDFHQLVFNLLDYRNKRLLPFVDNKVVEKALESDMTAAKLFYQRTGAIQSGSGGDRVQVNNQSNLSFMSPLPNKQEI